MTCGVDWNSEESQTHRFEQLSNINKSPDPFSVDDLGCGYSALYDFLAHRYESFSYSGIDVSVDMIRAAERRYQDKRQAGFLPSSEPAQTTDYCVASGIFNVCLGRSDDEWRSYLEGALDLLDRNRRFILAFVWPASYFRC